MELSPAELRVARLLAVGKCSKEIAFDLKVSKNTVDKQKVSIFLKLRIQSEVELAHYMLWKNMIPNIYSIAGEGRTI